MRKDRWMDRQTDGQGRWKGMNEWMNRWRYTLITLNLCIKQFTTNLPKINISTHHADTTVPTKNSHRKIKCCDDAYQANWIPLFKESVTWTWNKHDIIRMAFKMIVYYTTVNLLVTAEPNSVNFSIVVFISISRSLSARSEEFVTFGLGRCACPRNEQYRFECRLGTLGCVLGQNT